MNKHSPKKHHSKKPGLLLVANWDSDVGYAWWLMESYWAILANEYQGQFESILAYPSISTLPQAVKDAPILPVVADFSRFSVRMIVAQLAFIRRRRIRIVYLSDRAPRHWAYLLYRLAGVKHIVIHDHTPGVRTAPKGVKRRLKAFLNRIPGYSANICIGATPYIKKRFIDVGCVPPEKCFSADNGIPLTLPPTEDLYQRFGINREKRIVVTAARANRYKGALFALDVFEKLQQDGGATPWHYLYLGDGPDRQMLMDAAKEKGLDQQVSFPGRVAGVTALLPGATLAFHPSKGEVGYSLSILEYMLCGLPVVVPDNPSVCGATDHGKTGLIYTENDVLAAAEALNRLLNDAKLCAQMGEQAKKTVESHYSLTQTHRKLLDIFHRLVPKVNGHGPS
ncbi:glycosyltransferase family 4 protein [Marinimicrobium sp. ARAG 43.8]|uniref:glycosyltransferase family 4 protein n=1 Tax=Marinimicrobium sp. ARAG 43.8 TaxID=3418719 RepID=UPI003CF1F88D